MSIRFDDVGFPLLDQSTDEQFVDLAFAINCLEEQEDHYQFQLFASFNGENVGVDVSLKKGISGGFDSEMNLIHDHVYDSGVVFHRRGNDSKRLLTAISQLYKIPPFDRQMVEHETYTVIALEQGKLDFTSQWVHLKLFGHDADPFDEDAYYESFFNVNLSEGLVCWNEKDCGYRLPLLQSLTFVKAN